MTLTQAVDMALPRRRPGQGEWDSPHELGIVFVSDAIANDWEVMLPSGKISSTYETQEHSDNIVDFYARRHD